MCGRGGHRAHADVRGRGGRAAVRSGRTWRAAAGRQGHLFRRIQPQTAPFVRSVLYAAGRGHGCQAGAKLHNIFTIACCGSFRRRGKPCEPALDQAGLATRSGAIACRRWRSIRYICAMRQKNWPGATALFVSDVHLGPFAGREFARRLAEQMRALESRFAAFGWRLRGNQREYALFSGRNLRVRGATGQICRTGQQRRAVRATRKFGFARDDGALGRAIVGERARGSAPAGRADSHRWGRRVLFRSFRMGAVYSRTRGRTTRAFCFRTIPCARATAFSAREKRKLCFAGTRMADNSICWGSRPIPSATSPKRAPWNTSRAGGAMCWCRRASAAANGLCASARGRKSTGFIWRKFRAFEA